MLSLVLTLAQVLTVTASPAPDEASPLRGSVLWSVYACTDGPALMVSGARVEASLVKKLRLMPKPIAATLIAMRTSERWQSKTLRVGGAVLAGATAITAGGLVAASPRVISALAMGTTVAPEIGARLQASLPTFDLGQLLDASAALEIPAGGCAVRQVLAKRSRSMAAIEVAVQAPAARTTPTATSPTSIPTQFASF